MPKPMRKFAWSYSALSSFETCPHRHFRTKVVKDVFEPESEEMKWGNRVHKALENRVRHGTPLPTGMEKWEPLVRRLLEREGTPIAEQQLCLNEQLIATDWFGRDAWCRAIVDFMILRNKNALALDWKTGKVKEDHDQMMLFAAVLFHRYPELETVITGYVWLKFGNKITSKTFHRSDLSEIWEELLPRVRRFEQAFKEGKWQKRPSGLCKAWCPVLDCVHNGKNQ